MKNIAMPVNRRTVDCIWNTFRNSGKRHLIVTGTRGSGKTTLLHGLFPNTLPGITTWAEPKNAVFLKDNTSDKQVKVGNFDPSLPGPGNQMVLVEDGFLTLGIPILERCMESDSPWVTIDEIGYLEAQCEPYQSIIRRLFEKKQVAAVIRKQEHPFLEELCHREDSFVVDLDLPSHRVGCVIMASGLGKRFGGNKLMEDFHGKPMILRTIEASEPFRDHRVVVTRHQDVAELCRTIGVDVILHDRPYRSDTVRLGLEWLGDIEGCLFFPGDQPLLRKETVEAMLRQWETDPESILRPYSDETPGAPVLFPRWTFSELLTLPEGKGGGWILQKYPERVKEFQVEDPLQLMDVDTPETLKFLLEKINI